MAQWAGAQWGTLSGWVAKQFPALAACWNAFSQFAGPVWAKIQKVPILGDYMRIQAEILQGIITGDAIANPTIGNSVGQVVIGFTPVGWIGDARDSGLALGKLAKGEGNGLEALIAIAAIVPGLDALKGLRGGTKLLDHADEAADALKSVGDALRGLPPNIVDGVLKNPAMVEAISKNPDPFINVAQNPRSLETLSDITRATGAIRSSPRNPALLDQVVRNPTLLDAVAASSALAR